MSEQIVPNSAMLQKWTPAAYAHPEPLDRLAAPADVLTGEALDVAAVCVKYYEPRVDGQGNETRPGLVSAEGRGRFHKGLSTEVLELREALISAHQHYEFLARLVAGAPMNRARFLLTELKSVLRYRADDGVEDVNDERLARLNDLWSDAASQNAVGLALIDYATLAQMHREELDGLGGFDAALIDEARSLGDEVQMHSASKIGGVPPDAVEAAHELRNRVGTLLHERMQLIRSVARFVFRHQPHIAEEATSRYQRERRMAAYRAAKAKAAAAEAAASVAAPATNGVTPTQEATL